MWWGQQALHGGATHTNQTHKPRNNKARVVLRACSHGCARTTPNTNNEKEEEERKKREETDKRPHTLTPSHPHTHPPFRPAHKPPPPFHNHITLPQRHYPTPTCCDSKHTKGRGKARGSRTMQGARPNTNTGTPQHTPHPPFNTATMQT